jgi:hypothetical protein
VLPDELQSLVVDDRLDHVDERLADDRADLGLVPADRQAQHRVPELVQLLR